MSELKNLKFFRMVRKWNVRLNYRIIDSSSLRNFRTVQNERTVLKMSEQYLTDHHQTHFKSQTTVFFLVAKEVNFQSIQVWNKKAILLNFEAVIDTHPIIWNNFSNFWKNFRILGSGLILWNFKIFIFKPKLSFLSENHKKGN